MSATAAVPSGHGWTLPVDVGRPFVGRAFDLLVIGGGLSLLVVAALKLGADATLTPLLTANLGLVVLLSNSAHFAASTLRLYTKRDAFRDLPFLTMGLPLVTLAVLVLTLVFADPLGRHLRALYLSWSPYHYAAQAYGLALMYSYRSGGSWSPADKRLLRLGCLSPFLFAFLDASGSGLEWFAPAPWLARPAVHTVRFTLVYLTHAATVLLPLALLVRQWRGGASRLPLISLTVIASNAIWLITLRYIEAFVWATVFHGLQYLAIVSVFHVRERLAAPGNVRPWWQHAGGFYLACLALGYLLFQVWPHAFVFAGFTFAESAMLVAAVINIHHFIVDAFIWRLRRDPGNAGVVRAAA
ncbi:MAG TPA: hypothetical protein VF653_21085 [Methylomirabilota bacterium]